MTTKRKQVVQAYVRDAAKSKADAEKQLEMAAKIANKLREAADDLEQAALEFRRRIA